MTNTLVLTREVKGSSADPEMLGLLIRVVFGVVMKSTVDLKAYRMKLFYDCNYC